MARAGSFLDGTEVRGEATPQELRQELDGLKTRGQAHARRQRFGCAFTVLGVVAAGVLGAMQHYEEMGLLGVLIFAVYYYSTTLDPELADEPRVVFASELLSALPAIDGSAHLWIELNAYDMAVADERTPAENRTMRATYVQRWLELRFERDAVPFVLEAKVHAEQHQDGVHVLSATEDTTWTLKTGRVKTTLGGSPSAAEVAEWVEDSESAEVEE